MVAIGALAQAMVGTGKVANAMTCTPTAPASMQVLVTPGAIFAQDIIDGSDFGSIDDNDAPLVKAGINTTNTAFTLTAPATTGHSINYLIEAAFSETDTTALVLPYYNAANPAEAYSGPNNTGASQCTQRVQRVALTLKAGTSATTGAQTTPATDANNIALFVITVAHGATTVTAGNIAYATSAPFIGGGSLLPGRLIGVQKWVAAGISTYTPTPGTNTTIWEVKAGGASGGGAGATSAGEMAAGSGGGSGSFVRHRATSGFTGATVVVGAGGAAPSAGANNGNAGGTSSVTASGFTLSAPGGAAGVGAAAQATSFLIGPGVPGSIGTGGNIVNTQGDTGDAAIGIKDGSAYFLLSGGGGAGFEGGEAKGVGSTTAGVAGGSPGAGGSGGSSGGTGSGGSAQAGGAGSDGGVWVWEYS